MRVSEVRAKINKRRKRCDAIKVKVRANKNEEKVVVRFFPVNCNGFGPRSNSKIEQVIKERKRRDVDEILISSSCARW